MKEINTDERIIGDCLEVNSDIISMKTDTSGNIFSRFIRNIQANRYTKRLISIVKKLKNANEPLNKDNLVEFFTYIYNNYPPNGNHGNISVIKMLTEKVFVVYKYKKDANIIRCKFTIDINDKNFNLAIIKDIDEDRSNSYDVTLSKLDKADNDNPDLVNTIKDINASIISDICDYVLETIDNTHNSLKSGGNKYV